MNKIQIAIALLFMTASCQNIQKGKVAQLDEYTGEEIYDISPCSQPYDVKGLSPEIVERKYYNSTGESPEEKAVAICFDGVVYSYSSNMIDSLGTVQADLSMTIQSAENFEQTLPEGVKKVLVFDSKN